MENARIFCSALATYNKTEEVLFILIHFFAILTKKDFYYERNRNT